MIIFKIKLEFYQFKIFNLFLNSRFFDFVKTKTILVISSLIFLKQIFRVLNADRSVVFIVILFIISTLYIFITL
jgi:hypothetical protein